MNASIFTILICITCLVHNAVADTSTTIAARACVGRPTPKDKQQTFELAHTTVVAEIDTGGGGVKSDPFDRCDATLDADPDIATHRGGTLAHSGSWIEIYFYRTDASRTKTVISPAEASFVRVEVGSNGGKPLITKTVAYGTTVDVPLNDLSSLGHLGLVKVSIYYNGNEKPDDRYFRLYKRFSGYGLAGKETYFWIPVGLFGTSFKKDDNGYAFSAFPVGIAVGERVALNDSFYLGGSLMLDYTIYRDPSRTSAMTSSNVSLSGATLGVLVDINNLVYLGYGYVFDWRNGAANPGSTFVIGAGPGLIQYLQGKH